MSKSLRPRCWKISATRFWTYILSQQQKLSWLLHRLPPVKGLPSHYQPLTHQHHHKQVTQHHPNLLNQLVSHHHPNQPFHPPNQLLQHLEVHLCLPLTQATHPTSHKQRLITLHLRLLTQLVAIQAM